MTREISLTASQVEEIRQRADEVRKLFGVFGDVPIGNDIFMLLEKNNIILCEYPFEASEGSHTDATLTRFETKQGPIVFIGLNTSLPYDEQIFALAHELYHFITKTGKSYTDEEKEEPLIEKRADRFAAELLLPQNMLRSRIVLEFHAESIDCTSYLRTLRFIARLQGECGLPYHALVNRLYEEGFIPHFEPHYSNEDDIIKAYAYPFETEGLMIDLDKVYIVNWLIENKFISKRYFPNGTILILTSLPQFSSHTYGSLL